MKPRNLALDLFSHTAKAPNGCWIWQRAKDHSGYGLVRISGRPDRAHREAFRQRKGAIPAGHFVCHHCDTPSCINPDHLFAAPQRENIRDMIEKGRRFRPIGLDNGNATITPAKADEIYRAIGTKAQIARDFGVSEKSVYNIKNGDWWGHRA